MTTGRINQISIVCVYLLFLRVKKSIQSSFLSWTQFLGCKVVLCHWCDLFLVGWKSSKRIANRVPFVAQPKVSLLSTLRDGDRGRPEWYTTAYGLGGFAASRGFKLMKRKRNTRIKPNTRCSTHGIRCTRAVNSATLQPGVGALCVFLWFCTSKAHAQHFHFQSERFHHDLPDLGRNAVFFFRVENSGWGRSRDFPPL